jgi:hypothetical protein
MKFAIPIFMMAATTLIIPDNIAHQMSFGCKLWVLLMACGAGCFVREYYVMASRK